MESEVLRESSKGSGCKKPRLDSHRDQRGKLCKASEVRTLYSQGFGLSRKIEITKKAFLQRGEDRINATS